MASDSFILLTRHCQIHPGGKCTTGGTNQLTPTAGTPEAPVREEPPVRPVARTPVPGHPIATITVNAYGDSTES